MYNFNLYTMSTKTEEVTELDVKANVVEAIKVENGNPKGFVIKDAIHLKRNDDKAAFTGYVEDVIIKGDDVTIIAQLNTEDGWIQRDLSGTDERLTNLTRRTEEGKKRTFRFTEAEFDYLFKNAKQELGNSAFMGVTKSQLYNYGEKKTNQVFNLLLGRMTAVFDAYKQEKTEDGIIRERKIPVRFHLWRNEKGYVSVSHTQGQYKEQTEIKDFEADKKQLKQIRETGTIGIIPVTDKKTGEMKTLWVGYDKELNVYRTKKPEKVNLKIIRNLSPSAVEALEAGHGVKKGNYVYRVNPASRNLSGIDRIPTNDVSKLKFPVYDLDKEKKK